MHEQENHPFGPRRKMGQAEVTVNNSNLLINVKVSEQKPEALYKGDKALIVGENREKRFFIIEKY